MKDFPDFGNSYEPPAGAIIPDFDDLDPALFRSEGNYEPDPDILLRCGIDVDPIKSKPADYGVTGDYGSGKPEQTGRFIGIADFLRNPPSTTWAVRDFVSTDSTTIVIGEPSGGKSLVLIDMACHVATGREWCGHRTTQGLVLYVAGEGQHGLAKRFMAWFQAHNETPRNVYIATTPVELTNPADIAALIAEIEALPEPPVMVQLDTLNRNFGQGDENSTADMTKAVNGLDRIRGACRAAMVVAHHTGLADKGRSRGSSVLKGSADVEYLIEKDSDTNIVTMRHAKPPKDFDAPPALAWSITRQSTPWANDEGEPVDSVILKPIDVPAPRSSDRALGDNQQIALDLLKKLLKIHEKNLIETDQDPGAARVTFKEWYFDMKAEGFSRARCSDAKSSLMKRGLIKAEGEIYVRPV